MLRLAMLPVHLYEVSHVFVTREVGIPHELCVTGDKGGARTVLYSACSSPYSILAPPLTFS